MTPDSGGVALDAATAKDTEVRVCGGELLIRRVEVELDYYEASARMWSIATDI